MKYLNNTGLSYFWNKVKNYFVPTTRKINNKALSSDVSLTASDVGALSSIPVAGSSLGGIKNGGNVVVEADGKANVQLYSSIVSVTVNKTLALTDAQKTLDCSNTSDITITIPTNSSVAFTVGTELEVIQTATNKITIAKGTGVTVISKDDKLSLDAKGTALTLKKLATDTWFLAGDLA